MLKDLTNEKLIRLGIEAKDWEDAIRKPHSRCLMNTRSNSPI